MQNPPQIPVSIVSSTNPGTIDPANQCFPPPPPNVVQGASASAVNSDGEAQRLNLNPHQTQGSSGVTVTPASASLVNSNGETQRLELNIHQAANSGVTATPTSGPTVTVSGDDWQRPNLAPPEVATPTGSGLPIEVHAGSASQVRHSPPQIAVPGRPAIDLQANTSIPKAGLPKNVFVR